MKTRFVWIALFILLGGSAIAQKKQLTLEDAILNRYWSLAPEKLQQLQWSPEGHSFSFINRRNNLLMNAELRKLEDGIFAFNLDSLNRLLADSLKRMPRMSWNDAHSLVLFHKGNRVVINETASKIISKMKVPEKAENLDFCKETQTYAFTRGNNLLIANAEGETKITDDPNKNNVYGQSVSRNEFGIAGGTFWSPKGKYLAFYKKDESKVSDYPLVNFMERVAEPIPTKYPMAGMPSEVVSVGVYHLATKQTVYLEKQGGKEDYMTNISWSPDEKWIFVFEVNRGQNHMQLNQFDGKTGKFVKRLLEEKSDKFVEPQHKLVFLKNTPNQFLMFSNKDGWTHIYQYDTNGKQISQLTSGEWEVTRLVGCDEKRHFLYVEGTKDSPLERHLYRVNMRTKEIKKLTQEVGVHHTRMSADKKYFIDEYQSTEVPFVQQIINYKGKKENILLESKDNAKDYQFGENKIVEIPCKDGKNTLYGRLILPPNFDAKKKYPVILYVYGGPHAQLITKSWKNSARWWQYYMAQKGYIAFTLDNRGTPNRGRDFENVIHRQLGVNEMQDQMTGIEYLKSLPYVDANRIGVHGWSFGGFMTTNLMLSHPETFKVGVAGGPVIDWSMYEVMYGERYMDTPQENPEGYKNSNLLNKVENLQGRLMIIHGVQDKTVVMQHAMKFLRECVKKNKQVDFFAYPTHPHNVRGRDRVHLMEKVSRYFEENL